MHKNIRRPPKKLMHMLTSRGHQELVGWMGEGVKPSFSMHAFLCHFNFCTM